MPEQEHEAIMAIARVFEVAAQEKRIVRSLHLHWTRGGAIRITVRTDKGVSRLTAPVGDEHPIVTADDGEFALSVDRLIELL